MLWNHWKYVSHWVQNSIWFIIKGNMQNLDLPGQQLFGLLWILTLLFLFVSVYLKNSQTCSCCFLFYVKDQMWKDWGYRALISFLKKSSMVSGWNLVTVDKLVSDQWLHCGAIIAFKLFSVLELHFPAIMKPWYIVLFTLVNKITFLWASNINKEIFLEL